LAGGFPPARRGARLPAMGDEVRLRDVEAADLEVCSEHQQDRQPP
jgi:hypothetical protein